MTMAETQIPFSELVEELTHDPDALLEKLSDETHALTFEHSGKVYLLRAKTRRRKARKGAFTLDDSIFALAGAGHSKELTDITNHKHDYLAEEAADTHEATHP